MAVKKKKTNPRKIPVQARAVATVDAILQAATYILLERGWEGLNTNQVAERAGVNIASLYQYFPSKEAIVAELQRRHAKDVRAALPKLAELRTKRSLRELLQLIVDACIREHRVAPRLHRVFADELPRSARLAVGGMEDNVQQLWRDCIEPHVVALPDSEIAIFTARVSLHALVHEAASERPELLDSETFRDEVVLLLERYLTRAEMAHASRL